MLRFKAEDFLRAFASISAMRHIVETRFRNFPDEKSTAAIGEDLAQSICAEVNQLRESLAVLEANVTDIAAERLSRLAKEGVKWDRFTRAIDDMNGRLRDELSLRQIFVLEDARAKYYAPKEPLFGEKVFVRFSIANDDIAEAGKCLALEQGTASVFHLMRVMEAGLRALGNELGIPYAPSWEAYIIQINKILDTKNYAKLTDEQKAKRHFYQDVLGDLTSIKGAWRNPTMHIVRSYDSQQATVIYEAVKGLMQHLARELSVDPSTVISTGQSS